MNHFAIAENESKARVRLNLMEKLVQPCGPPPEKKSEIDCFSFFHCITANIISFFLLI